MFLTKVRQTARETGYWIAKEAGWNFTGSKPLQLHMVICRPDRRKRDDDNIVSSFKSYRDGIFQALGLDDSLIHRTIIDRGKVEKDGAIYVTLSEIEIHE